MKLVISWALVCRVSPDSTGDTRCHMMAPKDWKDLVGHAGGGRVRCCLGTFLLWQNSRKTLRRLQHSTVASSRAWGSTCPGAYANHKPLESWLKHITDGPRICHTAWNSLVWVRLTAPYFNEFQHVAFVWVCLKIGYCTSTRSLMVSHHFRGINGILYHGMQQPPGE